MDEREQGQKRLEDAPPQPDGSSGRETASPSPSAKAGRGGLRLLFPAVLSVIAALALEAFYFRNALFNGQLLGDTGDGRFCMLVAEHWYRALRGLEPWLTLPVFYPETRALAWSDLMVGVAPFHVLLRLAGLCPHLAYKYALVFLHMAGALGMLAFLRRKAGLGWLAALAGTVVFSHSHLVVPSRHTQLYAMAYLPFVAWAMTSFIQGWAEEVRSGGTMGSERLASLRRRRAASGVSAILLMAWTTCTAFYVAGFVAFFIALASLSAILLALADGRRRGWLMATLRTIARRPLEIAGYLAASAVALAPFLALELPARQSFGGRDWRLVETMLPTPPGLLNVFPTNLLFGWIPQAMGLPGAHELNVGWLPTTALLFAASMALAAVELRGGRRAVPQASEAGEGAGVENGSGTSSRVIEKEGGLHAFALFAMGLGTVLSVLAATRTPGGLSLWRIPYEILPGFDAMRAVSRLNVVMCMPAGIVCAFGVDRIGRGIARRGHRGGSAASVALLALCVLASVWRGGVQCRWTDSWAESELAAVASPPPSGCAVLAVEDSGRRRHFRNAYEYQLFAWEMANRFALPTVDGYSGQFPSGWSIGTAVGRDVRPRTEAWVMARGVKGACAYDLASGRWRPLAE